MSEKEKVESINIILPIITALIVALMGFLSNNYAFNKEKSFETKYADIERKSEYYIKTVKISQEILNTYIPIKDSICSGLLSVPNRKTVHITDKASVILNTAILYFDDSIDSIIEKILINEFNDNDCNHVSKKTYTKLFQMMNLEIQNDREKLGL